MQMDQGLDTGDIIAVESLSIDPDDTTATLTPKLNALAQGLLIKTLPLWVKQKITSIPQKNDEAILCQLIERADGKIEWDTEAESIYNRFRAFDPWPGIFTFWKKEDHFVRMKLINITLLPTLPPNHYQLGEVFQIDDSFGVQAGSGAILLHTVQLEGKTKMSISDFVRGNPDFVGSFLI